MSALDSSLEIALAIANVDAHLAGAREIRPVHFLLALLRIGDGLSANEARRAGLTTEAEALAQSLRTDLKSATGLSDADFVQLRRRLWADQRGNDEGDLTTALGVSIGLRALLHRTSASMEQTPGPSQAVRALQLLFQTPDAEVAPYLSQPTSPRVAAPMHTARAAVSFGVRDLTQLAHEGRLTPVIGRRQEIKTIARYLQRTSKRNVLLLGEAGVGKTAVVEGLAQSLSTAPQEFLRRLRIIEIDVGGLLSGARHRGDLEERMKALVEETRHDPNLVVFIDEIHLVMGAGAAGGPLDIANILKPALARDDFRCVGATTIEEYERHIKSDQAFSRRFQIVPLREPSEAEAREICRAWGSRLEAAQEVSINVDAIEAAVSLSTRYIPNRRLPDKAIDLIENAVTHAKVSSLSFQPATPSKALPSITRANVEAVLFEQYGIASTAAIALDTERVEHALRSTLVGQDRAVTAIVAAIRRLSMRDRGTKRSLGVLMFTGSTGSGKTLAAEVLGRSAFGAPSAGFVRFNLSELSQAHDIARLTGAPPGFVGHERAGALFEFTEKCPQGVILLDEIDKAHRSILDFFLQVFDNAEAIDSRGRRHDFQRMLFVLACNRPNDSAIEPIGFANSADDDSSASLNLRAHFRPEFLSRIDATVEFRDLDYSGYQLLLERSIEELRRECRGSVDELTIDVQDLERLCRLLIPRHDGVRGFLRRFETIVSVPVRTQVDTSEEPRRIRIVCADDAVAVRSY